jgi:hypothetical protein
MRLMRSLWFLTLCFFPPARLSWGVRNPFLPRPREIAYGTSRIPLAGLEIRFASSPTDEDRFAAEELASGLASRAQTVFHTNSRPAGVGVLFGVRRLAAAFLRPARWPHCAALSSRERRASSPDQSGSKQPHSRASPVSPDT